jgi:hypothetical protein
LKIIDFKSWTLLEMYSFSCTMVLQMEFIEKHDTDTGITGI